ncbi:MAG: hypothetical protein WA130_11205 [Candidatus Methanoperedens sp.]
MQLTKEQISAVKGLERAFAKCADANVHIHNHYGMLIAYDGNIVEKVDDKETDTPCTEGYTLKINDHLDSWADDSHFVHKKE